MAEFHGLLQNSSGALTENECAEVLEFIEGREFNLALETLCGFLLAENRRITRDLYVRIHSLGERLEGVDPEILDSIRAVVLDAR